jgi:hypothetical protein
MISHLMFAYDLLSLVEANERQMNCIMEILNEFCKTSSQEVSNDKTNIIFFEECGYEY